MDTSSRRKILVNPVNVNERRSRGSGKIFPSDSPEPVSRSPFPGCRLPKVNEEKPRLLGQHVVVQRCNLNLVLFERGDDRVHLLRDPIRL